MQNQNQHNLLTERMARWEADLILLGREADLAQLVTLLQQQKHLLLVNGLGGIGKTELCKRFFLDHYQDYQSAAWVDYRGSLGQSLITAFAHSRKGYGKHSRGPRSPQ